MNACARLKSTVARIASLIFKETIETGNFIQHFRIFFFFNTMLAKQNMSAGQTQATRNRFMPSVLNHQLNTGWAPLFQYGDSLIYSIYFAENLSFEPSQSRLRWLPPHSP